MILGGIDAAIRYTRRAKGATPLATFVASSAVLFSGRGHTGYSQFKRQLPELPDDVAFVKSTIRSFNSYLVAETGAQCTGEALEEFRRRVRKRVAAERSDCNARDAMSTAPYCR